MGVGPIAAALGAKIAAVSRLIGRLRARGLVETQRRRSDARVVLVSLTAEGTALRQRVVERRRSELRAALDQAQLPGRGRGDVDRLASVARGTGMTALAAVRRRLRSAQYLRKWVVLGALIGVISGLGAAVFFVALEVATRTFCWAFWPATTRRRRPARAATRSHCRRCRGRCRSSSPWAG